MLRAADWVLFIFPFALGHETASGGCVCPYIHIVGMHGVFIRGVGFRGVGIYGIVLQQLQAPT